MTLIAISASYGAGGSVAGPRLAERLGVPFVDRAIPTKVAESLDVPLAHALEHDENVGSLDRARDLYVRHFYGADPRDMSLFHLVVDSTAIGFDACADLVAKAAESR